MRHTTILFLTSTLLSCTKYDPILENLRMIQDLGDSNPTMALNKLDSLKDEGTFRSEYANYKYRLLKVRLRDKAYIVPESDKEIKKIVSYFERQGSEEDIMESYYYAGSVYRDLHNTPSALSYFLRALQINEQIGGHEIMKLKMYSNLHYLYYNVMDNENSLITAKEEYKLSKHLKMENETTCIHLGAAYRRNEKSDSAIIYFNKALDSTRTNPKEDSMETLYVLLMNYSGLENKEQADLCYSIIKEKDPSFNYGRENAPRTLARYYEFIGELDSCIYYNRRIIYSEKDMEKFFDAAKDLIELFDKANLPDSVQKYAKFFVMVSNHLNFRERQKLAATVNNEFRYYRNKEEEQAIKAENDRMRSHLMILIFLSISSILSGLVFYLRFKNKQYAKISRLTDRLSELKQGIAERELHIQESKDALNRLNQQIADYDKELKEKERELAEKTVQNSSIIRILHQTELQDSAEEVLDTIKRSASNAKPLSDREWAKLFQAVDSQYPTFKEELFTTIKKHISEKEMQVFYLIFLGMSNSEIRNLTGMQHVTVWRWTKKYAFVAEMAHKRFAK